MARWLFGTALAAALAGASGCVTWDDRWARPPSGTHRGDGGVAAESPPVPEPAGAPAAPEAGRSSAPCVIASLPSRSRHASQRVDYRVEGEPGALDRLELWVTPNGGAHWRLLAADPDRTPPLEATFEDGEWGIRWVAVDVERRGEFPRPGDPPSATIVVDTSPPEIVFDDERVWLAPSAPSGERYGIDLPIAVSDPNLDPAQLRSELSIGDGPWRAAPFEDGVLRLEVPATPARLRVRVVATDTFGHTASREKEIHPADRIEPPSIAFVDPPSGWVGAGRVLQLAWEGRWPTQPAATAALEFRDDGGAWRTIAGGLPTTGNHAWRVPRTAADAGELRVRLEAGARRDDAPAHAIPLRIDALPPAARIVAPSEGRGEEIPLHVEAGDSGGSGVVALSLWRFDASRWSLVGERPAGSSIPFRPDRVGEHRLWLVARDAAGLESEPPPADPALAFRLVVADDTRAIELLSFQDGGSYRAGGRHLVFFRTNGGDPAATVVHLEWSGDDGATWSRRTTVPARAGRIELELPDSEVPLARIRVVAEEIGGARREARSARPFRVDAVVPELAVTRVEAGPGGRSEIHFEVRGGGDDPVDRVVLYRRAPGESRWSRLEETFAAISPLRVELPAGTAVELRAIDAVGNEGAPPPPGLPPRHALSDAAPTSAPSTARIELLTEGGRAIASGSKHYVFWRSEAVPAHGAVRLEERLSAAGEWREVARGLPATGCVLWTAPAEHGETVTLRVCAESSEGPIAAELAAPFTIDRDTPLAILAGPATSRGRFTTFETRLAVDEGLERLEAWVRHVSTPQWRRVAEARIGTPLVAELADGLYHVAIVAVDVAGNRSDPPAAGAAGQGTLLVDTVPPVLFVDETGERSRLVRRGGVVLVRPRVTDANLSAFPLSFRAIEDGAIEGTDLERYHPNATEYAWRLPLRTGVHTLEVIAEDLAGNRAIQRLPATVIPTPPEVRFLADPAGSILAAGDELELAWQGAGVEPDWRGVTIEFSADGERFELVAAEQAADARTTWRVPAVDSNRCRFRLTIAAPDGLRGACESGPFTISSAPPRVRAGGIRPAAD